MATTEELVASYVEGEGMSIQEAVARVMKEQNLVPAGSQRTVVDRIAYIDSLTSIADVRKAIKSAYGKKSKSQGKPEAVSRYDKEVKAGQAKLNELMASIEAADDKLARAQEVGADASDLVQMILSSQEKELEVKLVMLKVQHGWSNKEAKALALKQKTTIPGSLEQKLAEISQDVLNVWRDRTKRGDQRVIAVNRNIRLTEDVAAKAATV